MRFGFLILAIGLLVACGNEKPHSDQILPEIGKTVAFVKPATSQCLAALDNAELGYFTFNLADADRIGTSQEDKEFYDREVGLARAKCQITFFDDTEFRLLAKRQLENEVEDLRFVKIVNEEILNFQESAFFGRKYIGRIESDKSKIGSSKAFTVTLDDRSFQWNVNVFADSEDRKTRSSQIDPEGALIGRWCFTASYEDGRHTNVMEIANLPEQASASSYPYEFRTVGVGEDADKTVYVADFVNGKYKLMAPRFSNPSQEYKIDPKGVLHIIHGGAERNKAFPVVFYDKAYECATY